MKSMYRILTVAALAGGFVFAANGAATTVALDGLHASTLAGCGGCGKDKQEGPTEEKPKGECPSGGDKPKGECPNKDKQTGAFQSATPEVMNCGSCSKDKKDAEKPKGECPAGGDKPKGECPGGEKPKGECPSGDKKS